MNGEIRCYGFIQIVKYWEIDWKNYSDSAVLIFGPEQMPFSPPLILIYINDLGTSAMEPFWIHDFTDDTNLLYSRFSTEINNWI